jgi:hypothetical protein
MCCEHHGQHGAESQSCCCGPHPHRRFLSEEERIAKLEAYKSELEREVSGVEQELQYLRQSA